SFVEFGTFVPAGVHEDTCSLAGNPLVDVVSRNLRKQKAAFARPHRAFGPFVEAGGDALKFGIRRHQAIESRVKLLNVLRERWQSESSESQGQQGQTMECHARDCTAN